MSQLRLVTKDGDPGPQSPPVVAIFCGSRDFDDRTIIETLVHGVSSVATLRGRPFIMVEGEARGADIRSREEAEQIGVYVVKVPADWDRHGKAAGVIRNIKMLEEYQPDLVIAFSDDVRNSRGTRHMCSIAKKAGVPTYVVGRFHDAPSS